MPERPINLVELSTPNSNQNGYISFNPVLSLSTVVFISVYRRMFLSAYGCINMCTGGCFCQPVVVLVCVQENVSASLWVY